jgi:hypothetical protein
LGTKKERSQTEGLTPHSRISCTVKQRGTMLEMCTSNIVRIEDA